MRYFRIGVQVCLLYLASVVLSNKKTHYEVLGTSNKADTKEIKRAFRLLATKWHPDKNQDNIEQARKEFGHISEAYSILSDPKKREEYDQEQANPNWGNEDEYEEDDSENNDNNSFGFNFEDFFGGMDADDIEKAGEDDDNGNMSSFFSFTISGSKININNDGTIGVSFTNEEDEDDNWDEEEEPEPYEAEQDDPHEGKCRKKRQSKTSNKKANKRKSKSKGHDSYGEVYEEDEVQNRGKGKSKKSSNSSSNKYKLEKSKENASHIYSISDFPNSFFGPLIIELSDKNKEEFFLKKNIWVIFAFPKKRSCHEHDIQHLNAFAYKYKSYITTSKLNCSVSQKLCQELGYKSKSPEVLIYSSSDHDGYITIAEQHISLKKIEERLFSLYESQNLFTQNSREHSRISSDAVQYLDTKYSKPTIIWFLHPKDMLLVHNLIKLYGDVFNFAIGEIEEALDKNFSRWNSAYFSYYESVKKYTKGLSIKKAIAWIESLLVEYSGFLRVNPDKLPKKQKNKMWFIYKETNAKTMINPFMASHWRDIFKDKYGFGKMDKEAMGRFFGIKKSKLEMTQCVMFDPKKMEFMNIQYDPEEAGGGFDVMIYAELYERNQLNLTKIKQGEPSKKDSAENSTRRTQETSTKRYKNQASGSDADSDSYYDFENDQHYDTDL